MSWKAIQRNSQDYIELKKAGVKFYKTPDAILRAQLAAWDKIIAKKGGENPLFKKVLDSQKAFAERAGQWQNDYMVDFKMAYNHYFGQRRQEGLSDSSTQRGRRDGAPFLLSRQTTRCRRLLLAVDRFSTWIGKACAWTVVGLTAADQLGGVLPLRAQQAARLGARRADHAVRHAVHDAPAPTR